MKFLSHILVNLCVIAVYVLQSYYIDCFPTGAPTSACQTMIPGHRIRSNFGQPTYVQPQTTLPPLKIVTNPSQTYDNSGKGSIGVWLYSDSIKPIPIQGLMIQVRPLESRNVNQQALGNWESITPGTKAIKCIGFNWDTVTHTNSSNKIFTVQKPAYFKWRVPQGLNFPVQFVFTLATEKNTFWTNIRSNAVQPPPVRPTTRSTWQTPATTMKTVFSTPASTRPTPPSTMSPTTMAVQKFETSTPKMEIPLKLVEPQPALPNREAAASKLAVTVWTIVMACLLAKLL